MLLKGDFFISVPLYAGDFLIVCEYSVFGVWHRTHFLKTGGDRGDFLSNRARNEIAY